MESFAPKISIVTPSYNQADFLERTIQSVLDQNYPNLEYIIIDGGSTDGSVDIIKKYEDRLTYWVSEPDNGQTVAINKGLSKISGEIWAYICSDDVYKDNVFDKVIESFQKHPDIGVVYGGCNFIDEHDLVTRVKYPGKFDRERLMNGNYLYQPSMFIKKSVMNDYGVFSEELDYGMDYEYWLRISNKVKFYYLDEILSDYRLHSDSKSMDRIVDMVKESSKIRKSYGAGFKADFDYFIFYIFGQYYYKFKRKLFNMIGKQ